MADLKIDGLGVALVTPFKKDFSIDYTRLSILIEKVILGGCDYIVVLGTTAETPTLLIEERNQVSEFIKKEVKGRVPLVVGIGGNATSRVINRIKTFDLNGYSAILSVTPFYNKPSQEGLYQHYRAIDEITPLPIILYNVPGRTGVNMSASTTLKLAMDAKNIKAIKEASGNIEQCEKILMSAPEGFQLISGDDFCTCKLMRLGAKGVISVLANAMPEKMKRIVELCNKSDFENASICQDKLEKLIKLIFADGSPAGIKALLSITDNSFENILRLPLVKVSEKVEKELRETYKTLFSLS